MSKIQILGAVAGIAAVMTAVLGFAGSEAAAGTAFIGIVAVFGICAE